MPPIVMVILMAIVFTTVLAGGQGLYWAWIAKKERENEELLRRLGSGTGPEEESELFREQARDSVASALGTIGESLEMSLRMADASYGVSTLLIRMMVAGGVTLVLAGIFIGPAGALVALLAAYLPLLIVKQQGAARMKLLVEQLPDSLELMARSLSAGLGLNDALKLVSEEMPMPVAAEFGRVTEEVRFGRDYREAFGKLLERNPGQFDLRIMVSSILLQRETGGNLIEILENISGTIRSRFLFDAKVNAMTSEAKFSALVLGSLPFFVLLILVFSNPAYLEPLWTTTPGKLLAATDVFAYCLGVFIMNDMTKVEV